MSSQATTRYRIGSQGQLQARASAGEQVVCYVVGGGLLLAGLARRSLLFAGMGGAIVYLGRTAHAGTDQPAGRRPDVLAGGPSHPHEVAGTQHREQRPIDEVEEASMESFPASDPPAFGVHRV